MNETNKKVFMVIIAFAVIALVLIILFFRKPPVAEKTTFGTDNKSVIVIDNEAEYLADKEYKEFVVPEFVLAKFKSYNTTKRELLVDLVKVVKIDCSKVIGMCVEKVPDESVVLQRKFIIDENINIEMIARDSQCKRIPSLEYMQINFKQYIVSKCDFFNSDTTFELTIEGGSIKKIKEYLLIL